LDDLRRSGGGQITGRGLPRTQRTSAIPVWFAVTGAKADERQTLLGRGSDAMAEFEWLPWMRW